MRLSQLCKIEAVINIKKKRKIMQIMKKSCILDYFGYGIDFVNKT